MKKLVRNLFAVIAATALVGSLASCSDSDAEDPFATTSTNANSAGGNGGAGNGGGDNGNQGAQGAGSFDMPENQYDKGNTQYKGPTGIASLAVGDKVKMTFKGKASKAFKGEFFIVDTTPTAGPNGYWGELAEKYVLDVPAEFNITHTFEITQKPWGTGDESTYFAVVGKGDATTIHIDYTELKFEKLGDSSSSGGTGGQQNNGTGENQQTTGGETTTVTTVTYSTARKAYTVSLTKAVDASVLGYVLQIDNDGTKDADGLKIDISNLKLSVKVGDADAVEKTFGEFNLVPNQWASPAYGKTDARKNLGLTGNLAQGTEITVQVLSGTVSNSAKAPSIIFALQEDADPYGMLGTESGDSQDIWLPAFAEGATAQARSISGSAVEFTVANDKASSVSESSPVTVVLQYTRADANETAIKIDPAELKIYKGTELVKTVTKIEGFSLNVWGGAGNAFNASAVTADQPMADANCKCYQLKIPLESVTSVSGGDKIKVHLVSGTVVGTGSNLAGDNFRASIGVGDDSLNGWQFSGIVTSDSTN